MQSKTTRNPDSDKKGCAMNRTIYVNRDLPGPSGISLSSIRPRITGNSSSYGLLDVLFPNIQGFCRGMTRGNILLPGQHAREYHHI